MASQEICKLKEKKYRNVTHVQKYETYRPMVHPSLENISKIVL